MFCGQHTVGIRKCTEIMFCRHTAGFRMYTEIMFCRHTAGVRMYTEINVLQAAHCRH
jgi:hypothetical protein